MTGRREDDGGCENYGGAGAAASAMVRRGEGEASGENGGVQGIGPTTWRSSSASRGEAASRWRRGELAHAGVTSLLAWWGRSSWLARAITALGRQVGQLVGCGQVSPFPFISILFYFCKFVAFLKMLRHLQKSPNYSCPLYRI